MKLTLERKIPLGFIVAIFLLVIIIFFAFRSMNSINEALHWEKHTQEVLLQLDEMLILMVNAETAARGFMVSKDETILEPYNETNQKIGGDLARLRNLTADSNTQATRISQLEATINERLAFLQKLIEIRRTKSIEETRAQVGTVRGRELSNSIRQIIGEMKNEEQKLLTQREADLSKSLQTTYLMLFGVGSAGIIFLGFANLTIYREIGKRRQAEEDLLETNKDLEKRVEERTHEILQKNEELNEQIKQREQTEDRHKLALEAGNLGTWIFNIKSNQSEIDERGLSFFGFSPEDFDGNTFGRLHQEDSLKIAELLQKSLKKRTKFNAEFRVLLSDGKVRWSHCMGEPQLDENGEVVRIVGNCRDITEQRESENKREEFLKKEQAARREAEIANRLRDEFLATVSHELRAPLNSILGWGRLLEKEILDEKTTRKAVETIIRNAESQNRLIEDLLDVSRIISGKLRLEITTLKPVNVIEAALETVHPAAEAKGITLEVKSLSPVSHISGDPNRLQQVVWNLLSNAIKFTPNGGSVTVELERTNGDIEIRVRDTGIGIKEEFLPYVFDRFRQADASSIRKFGGLGLGLAIVRHLVEMHGGTVSVFSEGESKGSTFTIKLPVITTPQVDEEFDDSKIPENSKIKSDSAISLDGLLVLVVDDEEDTRLLLVQSLTLYGATVVTAQSAEEGLTKLQDENPDVLVSDIGMPDEDGYSLIRKVRALSDEHKKNIPAIALTAFTRAQDRMRAMTAGYQNHVSKPVELEELVTVIASLTGRLQMKNTDF
ncbi:MAG TPA: CHASE3 domain-containing protein [Pyrinomonadaceae bacterium]|nr:CHASE3 domain-containing protein [Pyrinomonadaceae bacterium]